MLDVERDGKHAWTRVMMGRVVVAHCGMFVWAKYLISTLMTVLHKTRFRHDNIRAAERGHILFFSHFEPHFRLPLLSFMLALLCLPILASVLPSAFAAQGATWYSSFYQYHWLIDDHRSPPQ